MGTKAALREVGVVLACFARFGVRPSASCRRLTPSSAWARPCCRRSTATGTSCCWTSSRRGSGSCSRARWSSPRPCPTRGRPCASASWPRRGHGLRQAALLAVRRRVPQDPEGPRLARGRQQARLARLAVLRTGAVLDAAGTRRHEGELPCCQLEAKGTWD